MLELLDHLEVLVVDRPYEMYYLKRYHHWLPKVLVPERLADERNLRWAMER